MQTLSSNRPDKWGAALLATFAPPVAMMYVAQLRWAFTYFLVAVLFVVVGVLFPRAMESLTGIFSILFILIGAIHSYRLADRFPDGKVRPAYSRWYGLLGVVLLLVLVVFGTRAFLFEMFRATSASMQPTVPERSLLIVQKWGYGHYSAYGFRLFQRPISAPLERGDMLVIDRPKERSVQFLERLIGLPGDVLEYRGKKLIINGKPLPLRPTESVFDRNPSSHLSAYIESQPESLSGAEYSILLDETKLPSIPAPQDFPFREQCTYTAESMRCEVPAGHYFVMGDNRDNSYDSRSWGFVEAGHIVGKVIYVIP